jgi:hypothetical protein
VSCGLERRWRKGGGGGISYIHDDRVGEGGMERWGGWVVDKKITRGGGGSTQRLNGLIHLFCSCVRVSTAERKGMRRKLSSGFLCFEDVRLVLSRPTPKIHLPLYASSSPSSNLSSVAAIISFPSPSSLGRC